MKKHSILGIFAALSLAWACSGPDSFIIVIDPRSYAEAKEEVHAYADAIHKADGYRVTILEDRWGVPDSLRAQLKEMHFARKNPALGAVFVGEIPVAMVRGAQHLASAFKMDENRYPREDSSIPSDRYYDDFSLEFESIGHDEDTPLFYYYLSETGAQELCPDMFSGRIRPIGKDGKVDIEALKAFLLKAADARLNPPAMDQMLFFSGHGYISESKTARLDEKRVWMEHFPTIDDGHNHISYIDYSDVVPVKQHLMNEMMRPELNLAMLHHHGAPDTEYLSATARPYMVKDAKEYIVKNLRQHLYKMRARGKDYKKAQADMKARFDVPDSWFKDAYSEEKHIADSLDDAALDLYLEDFEGYGYKPAAQLVILDACYNGSFQLDDCIAHRYLFGETGTVAVQANSVNSLQDKWHDRFFGIVASGGCAGDLARFAPYIESHIMGDPTFRFAGPDNKLDRLILHGSKACWKKVLKKGTPDEKALAVEMLFRKGALSSAKLLDIYRESPYATVRMEALWCLLKVNDSTLVQALGLALDDADELVRRMAVKMMGKSGDSRLVPYIVRSFLTNNATSRIVFDTNYALIGFDKDELLSEFDSQIADIPMVRREEETAKLRASLERAALRFYDDELAIMNPETSAKVRKMNIRQIRNYLCCGNVPALLDYLVKAEDPAVKIMLLEALGWHSLAYNSADIASVALEMSRDESLDEGVRKEALKTWKRIGK